MELEFVLNKIDAHLPILSHVDENKTLEEKLEMALAMSNFLLDDEKKIIGSGKCVTDEVNDTLLEDQNSYHVPKESVIGFKDNKKILGSIPKVSTSLKLEAMGYKLFHLFSGKNALCQTIAHGEDSTESFPVSNQSKESRSLGLVKNISHIYEVLAYLDVPTSLCSMISSLVGSDGNITYRYESISEVVHDLEAIIKDPQIFMYKPSLETLNGRLEFSNKSIYGRSKEMKLLFEVYQRVFHAKRNSEIVLISGYPGVGKSFLAHQIKNKVSEWGGNFLTGKFEQLKHSNKMSALVSAFNDYCDILIKRNPTNLESIKSEIRNTLDSGCKVLTDLIPRLCDVIGEPKVSPDYVEGDMVMNRRNRLFHSFLNVISSHCSTILFLDDLQWADTETLTILRTLVSARNQPPVLIIGCYRDNEVYQDHPLIDFILHMDHSKTHVTKIKLDNLGQDDTNDLLSETLRTPPTMTRPLTAIVHKKTSGHPMFVVEFMKSLFADKLLTFSLKKRQWDWDIKQIEAKSLANHVVELLKNKMLRLDEMVLETLKIASCLGSHTDESTYGHISSILGVDNSTFLGYINHIVDEGLLQVDCKTYMFVHDQIESAAYALISDDTRPSLHLNIGKLLLASTDKHESDYVFCEAVSQMNRGIILLESSEEKIHLAKLNLKAGKIASTKRSFSAARLFFENGLSLLNADDWKNNYRLILDLTNNSLESAYICGDYVALEEKIRRVLTKTTHFDDRLCAYQYSINSLGSSHKLNEALRVGLVVLNELGVHFPPVIDESFVAREKHLTRLSLDGFSEEELVYLPEITDQRTIKVFNIMDRLFHVGLFCNYLEPIVLRFIRMSTEKGVFSDSALGFAAYGFVLCSQGEYAAGYRFGEIARKLVGRFQAKNAFPKVIGIGCCAINLWSSPIELSLQPCLDAIDMGMIVGDTQFTAMNMANFISLNLICGSKLPSLLQQTEIFLDRMFETKQELMHTFTTLLSEAILKLVKGFDGKISIYDEIQQMEDNLPPFVRSEPFLRTYANILFLWLKYLFGGYNDASKNLVIIEQNQTNPETLSVLGIKVVFFGCLNSLALAHKSEGQERVNLRRKARKYLEKMKTWSRTCEWNFQHKYHLLNAEWHWMTNNIKSALSEFDLATEIANKHRAIHDEALINERAGFLESCLNNPSSANKRFIRAKELYLEWGSKTKADHIDSHLSSLNLTK